MNATVSPIPEGMHTSPRIASAGDMFWGDRDGQVRDPFGHAWSIATHIRDVSPEEIQAASKLGCPGV